MARHITGTTVSAPVCGGASTRMRKYLFLPLLAAALMASGCAVWKFSGPYSGVVLDKATGMPIPGAAVLAVYNTEALTPAGRVTAYFDARETITDARGAFRIPLRLLLGLRPLHFWADGPYIYILKAEYDCDGYGDTVVRRGKTFEPWDKWPLPEWKEVRVSLPRNGHSPCGPSWCPLGHCDGNDVPFDKMRAFMKEAHLQRVRHGSLPKDTYDKATELFLAVEGNDAREIDKLIARGFDPDARNSAGVSPLLLAVERGYAEIVDLLMKRGARIDGPGPGGVTPLLLAFAYHRPELAATFLARGADVNLANASGTTPLMAAGTGGYADLVEFLLAHGARIDTKDSEGHGPLHRACGHPRIIESLLARGVDINARDPEGFTVLSFALMSVRDPGLRKEIAILLLDRGLDPNLKDRHGAAALAQALLYNSWEIGSLLIDRGADVNAETDVWGPPLMIVSSQRDGSLDLVEKLLVHGARLNVLDRNGNTALMSAVRSRNQSVARLLVARGAEVNSRNRSGQTALGLAIAAGLEDLSVLLIAHGALE